MKNVRGPKDFRRGIKMRIGIGQDSHAFEEKQGKPLILGGVVFEGETGLEANSDGDIVLHAITRAIGSIIGKDYLAGYAQKLCKEKGVKDSKEFLKPALKELNEKGLKIASISISIECKKPKIVPKTEAMQESIAGIMNIEKELVGITAETGDNLTEFSKGKGIRVVAAILANN